MLIEHSHDPALVALVLVTCYFAAFTALSLGAYVRETSGRVRLAWWAGEAIAMGSAIWSMHFIAMLAFSMGEMPISYGVEKTLASFILAVVFSGIGIGVTMRQRNSAISLVVGGTLMGLGVAGMHYLGMDAMQMDAQVSYDRTLVGVSVVIAIIAATAALWLSLHLRSLWTRLVSALIMCIAIAGMHYTGMAAASYTPVPDAVLGSGALFAPAALAYGIAVSVTIVSALGLISISVDARLAIRILEGAKQLREDEERAHRLALVAEHTKDMVIIADQKGQVEWVNHAFEQHTGFVLSEIRGLKPDNFLTGPKTDPIMRDVVRAHIDRQKPISVELQNHKKDGTAYWVEMTITPIVDQDNQLTNFISIEHDITDRVRAQQGLDQALKMFREEKERFELAVEASADGIWDWEIGTGHVFFSNHFVEKFGYLQGEIANRIGTIFKKIHPDDRNHVRVAFKRHLKRREPCDIQYRLRQKDGTYRWVRTKGQATWDKDGKPTRMMGNIADIHKLVALTEQLQQRTFDVGVALQQNETILQSVREGICGIGLDGQMTFANSAACTMLGFSREQMIDKPWKAVIGQPAPGQDQSDLHKTLIDGEETRSSEEIMVRADGANFPIEYTIVPVREDGGDVTGAIVAFHDITRRIAIEVERQEIVRQLEQANRLKSEFLANMSHEIRTPMNGVLGMCQHLLRTDLDEDQRECAEVVLISARALLSLINSVLDLAKIEAGLVVPDIAAFQMKDLVHSVIEIVRPTATEKSLVLETNMSGMEGGYIGDEPRLRQVMLNLVGNAVKFTDQGSVVLRITAGENQMVRFEIADTGPGIPATYLESVFDRFTQVDASHARRHGGTGLGLAITKEIVQMFGGEIGVESTDGHGSTFWFSVPLARDTPRETITAGNAMVGSTMLDRPIRILLAEDNETNTKVAQKLLGELAKGMVCVETGAAALEELEKRDFDLVLMDIQMPVMTGDEAIRRIRSSDRSYRDIPIIVLTANAMTGVREEMLALGADDYVSKPLDVDILLTSISELLTGRVSAVPNIAS